LHWLALRLNFLATVNPPDAQHRNNETIPQDFRAARVWDRGGGNPDVDRMRFSSRGNHEGRVEPNDACATGKGACRRSKADAENPKQLSEGRTAIEHGDQRRPAEQGSGSGNHGSLRITHVFSGQSSSQQCAGANGIDVGAERKSA
jgi:hypothetical protein